MLPVRALQGVNVAHRRRPEDYAARMTPRLIPALILAVAALPAQAEVYKWVDAKGQVNYSNTPPPSVAGKAQQVEERISVIGMDPGVRAYAERHFAQKAYQDELDWQQRQRSMAAQQASYGYESGYDGSYYPTYYYPGYYTGFVRRPFLTGAIISNSPRVTHHSSRPAFHGSRSTGR